VCALGHHYKVVQWSPLVCSVPAEVAPEVSVQITKGPSCAVWFSRESTPLPTHSQSGGSQKSPLNVHHRLVRQTRFYHIGSWLYCFHGWSLHEPVLRFGYDDYHRLPESTRHSPELLESTERSSKPITQIPILHTNREQQLLTW
jgi:hypothetical protein